MFKLLVIIFNTLIYGLIFFGSYALYQALIHLGVF